jgi:hypothetical protein
MLFLSTFGGLKRDHENSGCGRVRERDGGRRRERGGLGRKRRRQKERDGERKRERDIIRVYISNIHTSLSK